MNKLNKDELGFNRVKELVANHAITPEAKKAIIAMQPKTSINAVTQLLNETAEMLGILRQ